ncbi:MAG TPA: FAD-binding protein [Actinomycetota bacterium]|nr:FAD-binding protein [Actinomycetota bacterium]
MLIPRHLLADPAGGLPPAAEVDVLVVGSGVAGLSAALAVPRGRTALLATKDRLGHSATRYAQGGIAAVLGLVEDSVAEHVADTLAAGARLCDPVAVQTLVEEGGQAIADPLELGVGFDTDPSAAGSLARTREGGHSRPRVVHAGGDATGAELERALTDAVRAAPSIRSVEHSFLIDLATEDGRVTDLDGRASLPGLLAVGEAACTGVHGADRLASNSLLEGVVFAARIGRALEQPGGVEDRAHLHPEVGYAPPPGDPAAAGSGDARAEDPRVVRDRVRRVMTDRVGVVRSGEGLAGAMDELERLTVDLGDPGPAAFEVANLVQPGRAVADLAVRREGSRGGHWRSDHPAPVEAWGVRQTLTRSPDGAPETGLLAVPAAEEVRR